MNPKTPHAKKSPLELVQAGDKVAVYYHDVLHGIKEVWLTTNDLIFTDEAGFRISDGVCLSHGKAVPLWRIERATTEHYRAITRHRQVHSLAATTVDAWRKLTDDELAHVLGILDSARRRAEKESK